MREAAWLKSAAETDTGHSGGISGGLLPLVGE